MTSLLMWLLALVVAAVSVGASNSVCISAGLCEQPTQSNVLLQTVSTVAKGTSNLTDEVVASPGTCGENSWPDRDHGLVCGSCKVLVNRFSSFYKTCRGYCSHIGRQCVGAWEERGDTCDVLYNMTCDQTLDSSDAICQCSAEAAAQESDGCYGQLSHLAEHEGNGVGSVIYTQSAAECQRHCSEQGECKSFTLCPNWHKCWMKDRSFSGGETTQERSDCRTYYKKPGCNEPVEPGAPLAPAPPPVAGPSCTGSSCPTLKVMSYNTEYRDYNARMPGYAEKIKDIAPAIVGLQECQNRDGLARLSGYTANMETGSQNYMLFDPSKVTLQSGGWMPIPRDDYAPRAITWGKFKLGDATFLFFNTHLPHNHNEARSQTTHARIANMLLQKRRELGAEHTPTIVVGDMNSHASNFNRVHTGGFESNLVDNGFVWAYSAKGGPGYGGIDHILYSAAHWAHNNCRDTGTGGSDHTSITCDLELK